MTLFPKAASKRQYHHKVEGIIVCVVSVILPLIGRDIDIVLVFTFRKKKTEIPYTLSFIIIRDFMT